MEEGRVSPPDSIPSAATTGISEDPQDASLQRKHAAMLERLNNLQQSRLARKPNSNSLTAESTQSFLKHFNQSKLSIESHLSRISQTGADPSSDSINVKSELENITLSISELEKFVAENSYFLPSYEVHTCLKTISYLRQSLDDVTYQVIPKKKFSFKTQIRTSEIH